MPRKSIVGEARACLTCNRTYKVDKARSRHCNKCRHTKRKKPCMSCGGPCDERSERCQSCASLEGVMNKHSSWKGGAIVSINNGYRYLRVPPTHPRVKNRKSNWNYVQEHILVMEAHIGRYLLPHENVHHKYGDRLDNRIESLELWSKSQPAGQRVSDKVEWAREILALYGGQF